MRLTEVLFPSRLLPLPQPATQVRLMWWFKLPSRAKWQGGELSLYHFPCPYLRALPSSPSHSLHPSPQMSVLIQSTLRILTMALALNLPVSLQQTYKNGESHFWSNPNCLPPVQHFAHPVILSTHSSLCKNAGCGRRSICPPPLFCSTISALLLKQKFPVLSLSPTSKEKNGKRGLVCRNNSLLLHFSKFSYFFYKPVKGFPSLKKNTPFLYSTPNMQI